MSGATTNYSWVIPTLGENPYYTDMLSFFTSVDAEMKTKTQDFGMNGHVISGTATASGNLTLTSTTMTAKGLINLGTAANAPSIDETKGVIILPHVASVASPANGSVYTTSAGLFAQINGAPVGPMAQVGSPVPQGSYTVVSKTANYGLLVGDINKIFSTSGNNNITFTLVPPATAGAG